MALFLCLLSVIAIQSCSKKNQGTANDTSEAQSAKEAKPECSDGQTPQILEGEQCPGSWIIQSDPKSGRKFCSFKYGPAISCPEGTKSTTYQAVCYGAVPKESKSVPSSVSDCESMFGKVPNPAPYRLACCPK